MRTEYLIIVKNYQNSKNFTFRSIYGTVSVNSQFRAPFPSAYFSYVARQLSLSLSERCPSNTNFTSETRTSPRDDS